jgi:outer membrane immunogenic protein
MKKTLISAAAFMLLAIGSATAADMFKMPPPAPGYDWTGFYLGPHLGGYWNSVDWFEDSTTTGSFLVGPVGFHDASVRTSGVFGGGQGGWNYQIGWFVWGIEADGSAGALSGNSPCFSETAALGFTQSCSTKISALGTFTARIGAAFGNTLLYLVGGGAWEDEKLVDACNACGPGGTSTSAVYSQGIGGLTFGAGIEYAFAGKWSAFLQYNYVAFGTRDLTFLYQPPNVPLAGNYTEDIRENVNVIKFGINYRFGGPYW